MWHVLGGLQWESGQLAPNFTDGESVDTAEHKSIPAVSAEIVWPWPLNDKGRGRREVSVLLNLSVSGSEGLLKVTSSFPVCLPIPKSPLAHWFSDFTVHQDHLEGWQNTDC